MGKALWFIESNLGGELSLAGIATASGVSRYHLLRAFGAATGHSVMGYVRARRLTEAARLLAAGAADILGVALDAGYASHEAFTRAFRDQFGLTPEATRAQRHSDNIHLVEAIGRDDNLIVAVAAPRVETRPALLIAGLGERYSFDTNPGIPFLWQKFRPYIGHIPTQIGDTTYGVCHGIDHSGRFEYIAGVEIGTVAALPKELRALRVPKRRYLVFTHRGHIFSLRATVYTIWNKWLPASGHKVAAAPDFELYGDGFNPHTGLGAVEIWLPIEPESAAQGAA